MEKKLNILIVDDEQIVLDSIKKILKKEKSYELSTALCVEDALKIIDNYNIQIILTDLMMPDIDGLEFIKMIKDRDKNVIMIMITGYATINTALQAMQIGAFDYIAKPFTRDELKSVVKRAADLAEIVMNKGRSDDANKSTEQLYSIQGIGRYSWIMMQEDDTIMIGVERPFLINVGSVQTLYLPTVGDVLRQGSSYFQVFSNDLRSHSLSSPFSGTVIAVNKTVEKNPALLQKDPYGEGWLIRLRPSNFEEERKLLGL